MKGKVYNVDGHGAVVDLAAKSSAYLPVREACIHNIRHVEEAGIVPGMVEEFEIIEETEDGDNLILSLRTVQFDLAWERCRQLQTEDVVVKGKVSIYTGFLSVSYYVHLLMHSLSDNLGCQRYEMECILYRLDAHYKS